jgi:hypothetical protein
MIRHWAMDRGLRLDDSPTAFAYGSQQYRVLFGAGTLVVHHDARQCASERGFAALAEWRTEPTMPTGEFVSKPVAP